MGKLIFPDSELLHSARLSSLAHPHTLTYAQRPLKPWFDSFSPIHFLLRDKKKIIREHYMYFLTFLSGLGQIEYDTTISDFVLSLYTYAVVVSGVRSVGWFL